MELSDRIGQIESEIFEIKSEMLGILLDVKEKMLESESPFTGNQRKRVDPAPVVITQTAQAGDNPHASTVRTETADRLQQVEDERQGSLKMPQQGPEMVEPICTAGNPDDITLKQIIKSPLAVQKCSTQVLEKPEVNNADCLEVSKLCEFIKWTEDAIQTLGVEKTSSILDYSEMTGYIPKELSSFLSKIAAIKINAGMPKDLSPRSYLSSIRQLGLLLGEKNVTDFVMFHLIYNKFENAELDKCCAQRS